MTSYPKNPRETNTHLREMAQKHGCNLRWTQGCLGEDTSTTVLCHGNSVSDGKGMGYKESDSVAAFGCFWCHAALDQGKRSRDEKSAAMHKARVRQLQLYVELVQSPLTKAKDRAAAEWAMTRLTAFLESRQNQ